MEPTTKLTPEQYDTLINRIRHDLQTIQDNAPYVASRMYAKEVLARFNETLPRD